uniref:Uncharacterized protein n=1 Tax=Anguilla anguilla TaxID=7936 RepID=A0A0E9VTS6_ANGAN
MLQCNTDIGIQVKHTYIRPHTDRELSWRW